MLAKKLEKDSGTNVSSDVLHKKLKRHLKMQESGL